MVKIINKILALLTLTVILTTTLVTSTTAFALTNVTASVDSNPVMSNESIVLTVIADDSVDRDALDTSPLLTNFIVARTEVSSQTSIVNLSMSKTTQWQIVLMPRSTGNLTIPSLTIDGHQSQPINIKVIEQGSTGSTQQQDIFISTELSSNDIYVQQLVTLTIKLHIGVQLQRGSLSEPTLEGAVIEQVGKDIENDGIVNGKRYRIIERTYAITPEQSGEFTLVTPMFSGDVMVQSQRRSGFLSFGETKPVNVLGEKLSLNVRPIPDSFPVNANNPWLPSELLTLHQEWQPEPIEFKVGEPITRTILLTAEGLGKAQLPNIVMDAPAGLKIYPDQAELHSSVPNKRLISQKRQNFALVASQAGDYILPKITIAWWNTVTNKYQQAILPEQTITIKANPDAPKPLITNSAQPRLTQTNDINTTQLAPISQPIIERTNNLQWLFLALWLLTCIAWALHVIMLKRSSSAKSGTKATKKVNDNYLALMAACKQNNAEKALNLILPWLNNSLLQANNNEIATLSEAIQELNNEAFTQAINDIQHHLFGKRTIESNWNGEHLLKAIQQINSSGMCSQNKTQFVLNPN
ncbi:BatD family protein [Colwellia sp. E150_009]